MLTLAFTINVAESAVDRGRRHAVLTLAFVAWPPCLDTAGDAMYIEAFDVGA